MSFKVWHMRITKVFQDESKTTIHAIKVEIDDQTWEDFKFLCKRRDHKTTQGTICELITDFVENRREEAAICRQS